MPTTKPVSNSLAADQVGATAVVDDGMQIIKAQLASATVLPQKIWETQFAMASEILAFMGRRMQAQAEFCARLSCCKEIGEAVDAQQDFAKGVGGDYADEAEKLSTLARKNMDAWTGAGAQYVSGWTGDQKAAA
ncbi:phasin family protein [Bosea sp. (in: a-proteobacteria)]|uniref:phasin family protein n=1 Tax=Bosea sp. (in: a-proteobacteria) TaxID=1871050 RepID=UPI0026032CDB|nr:phasin family protein [Bosea sp. (in: a-proteobacteria)]MCO5090962.1 hypothetical protein [Bosea sp. (in: a-proteobacteria)]